MARCITPGDLGKKLRACSDAITFVSRFTTIEEAWDDCYRGDWMLWFAYAVNVPMTALTLAKAMCADTARHFMTDPRSRLSVDTAKEFSKGGVSLYTLRTAYIEADCALKGLPELETYPIVLPRDPESYLNYRLRFYSHFADYHAANSAVAAAKSGGMRLSQSMSASSAACAVMNDLCRRKCEEGIVVDRYDDEQELILMQNYYNTADICREILTKEVMEAVKDRRWLMPTTDNYYVDFANEQGGQA